MSSADGARLLERLLADPDFRANFRRDPARAAREAGFGELAEELTGSDRPFQTLEIRESRSSAAGVMLAAAVEGLGLFELSEHALPHLGAEDALAADPPPQPVAADSVPQPVAADPVPQPAAADQASQPAQALPAVDPDDVAGVESDDADAAESDDGGGGGGPDDGDEEPDEEEPDEEEPDEEEPDEEEPDEEEPDEDEPDDAEDAEDDPDDGAAGDDSGNDSDDRSDGSDADTDDGGNDDSDDSSDGSDADTDDGHGDDDVDSDEDIDFARAPDAYPGDDAPQGQVGAWMANAAHKRGLPPELPVMASMVESGMKNLPGGDADSIGFFQMRVGIWNTGDYAGYPERPELQLDWFLDHAEAVKAQRVARGLPTDPEHYGEWIADVEQPAAQYRGRYQLRLDEAQRLLRRAFPDGDGVEELVDKGGGSGPRPGSRAREAVAEARKYLGTPYRWGGESPQTGFDCSGLVQWAYAKAGIEIPRVTDQQINAPGAVKVGRKHLLPGDLVFFRDASGYVHHVGMSLGGDRFIEAPRTGLKVRISSLDDPYYAQQFTGGRRLDAPAPGSNDARVMRALRLDDE